MAPIDPPYEEGYYRSREVWPDFRQEAELLVHLAGLAPGRRVLELGCGSGELLRRLESSGATAVGVDLSMAGLRIAQGSRRGKLLSARAEALPFAPGAFDAVVGQHLVEHLPDTARALSEWKRVLKPGGVLALVTPNALFPDQSLFYDPTHVRLLTPSELASELKAAGFHVQHLTTLFPYLGRGRLARAASIRLARLAGRVLAGRSIVISGRT